MSLMLLYLRALFVVALRPQDLTAAEREDLAREISTW